MTQRTKPDSNQGQIAEAVDLCPGCTFIDTHDVPRNLPELKGFPDGFIADEGALTIICEDTRQVLARVADLPGVRVLPGALIPVEVKTEDGKLRDSQTLWAQKCGVASLVLRARDEVFELFGVEVTR